MAGGVGAASSPHQVPGYAAAARQPLVSEAAPSAPPTEAAPPVAAAPAAAPPAAVHAATMEASAPPLGELPPQQQAMNLQGLPPPMSQQPMAATSLPSSVLVLPQYQQQQQQLQLHNPLSPRVIVYDRTPVQQQQQQQQRPQPGGPPQQYMQQVVISRANPRQIEVLGTQRAPDLAPSQLGTVAACCCPFCGCCIGAAVWAVGKDSPWPEQRQWANYACGAGLLNFCLCFGWASTSAAQGLPVLQGGSMAVQASFQGVSSAAASATHAVAAAAGAAA